MRCLRLFYSQDRNPRLTRHSLAIAYVYTHGIPKPISRRHSELHWLSSLLSPDATFIDIGEKMSVFSLYAAHCQIPAIIAIEDNLEEFVRFQKILSFKQPFPIQCVPFPVGTREPQYTQHSCHHEKIRNQSPISAASRSEEHPLPLR